MTTDPREVSATIVRPTDQYGSDWNWAEAATGAWLAAAREAGLIVRAVSTEVSGEYTAARVLAVDPRRLAVGRWYTLELRGDTIRAHEDEGPPPMRMEAH